MQEKAGGRGEAVPPAPNPSLLSFSSQTLSACFVQTWSCFTLVRLLSVLSLRFFEKHFQKPSLHSQSEPPPPPPESI